LIFAAGSDPDLPAISECRTFQHRIAPIGSFRRF
jgi:hypothetical protein